MNAVVFLIEAITVVLSAVWLVSRFVLVRPASRDLAWRLALVAAALLPGLALAREACRPWQWAAPILPAGTVATGHRSEAGRIAPQVGQWPHAEAAAERSVLPAGDADHPAVPLKRESPVAVAAAAVDSPVRHRGDWKNLTAAVWIAGGSWQLVRILRSTWKARRVRRLARTVTDAPIADINAWAARRTGLSAPVALLESAQIDVPVVCGVLRGCIIVPVWLLEDACRPQLRAALLHEYGHVRRRDLAYELLLELEVAAFWLHPLVHLLARELRRLRETICDNYVLADEPRVPYAELLLRLSVNSRLRASAQIGLAILTRTHQLESRVEELLDPERSIETHSARSTAWLLAATLVLALLAALLVRVDRVAAAPPDALDDQEDHKARAPNANPGARAPLPLEFRFRIVDRAGEPVAGATVTPWALVVREGSLACDDGKTLVARSDANGFVTVVFTKQMNAIVDAIVGRAGIAGIRQIGLSVDHPDHPLWSQYIAIGPNATIILQDSTKIEVRARRRGEGARATRLYPLLGPGSATDYSEGDGVLTIRRVDVAGERGSRWLRVVQAPESGPVWMSGAIDLRAVETNPIRVETELSEAISVRGALGEMVPRPIKNGRVIAVVSVGADNRSGPADLNWSAAADIAADGTFVLESIPANGHLQIIALCDGWVSRSPTRAETAAYAAEHGFPTDPPAEPSAGMVAPQLVRLKGDGVRPTVAMDPTTACKVTALDRQAKPLPNADVAFFPNQFFYGHGSTLLGTGRDLAAFVRERLAAGNRQAAVDRVPDARAYSQKTDQRGEAVVSGLPVPRNPNAVRHAQFVVNLEGYVAVPNIQLGDPGEFPVPILVAPLSPDSTAQVTIRMNPLPKPGEEPNAAAVPDDDRPDWHERILSGQVVDENGLPIEGVEVLPFNQDELRIRTDESGRFRWDFDEPLFEGDEPDVMPTRFIAPGYAPCLSELRLGADDQVITLDTHTYFEGIVRNPDGKPAANVRVRAHQEWRTSLHPEMSEDVWTETRTDARGHYKLLVHPAAYVITAGNSRHAVAWIPQREGDDPLPGAADERNRPDPPRVLILSEEARRLDVQLEAGADFRVRVVDGMTGNPVAGATIWAPDYPGSRVETDESGAAMIRALPIGEVTLRIWSRDYQRIWSDAATKRWKDSLRPPGHSSTGTASLKSSIPFELRPDLPEVTIVVER